MSGAPQPPQPPAKDTAGTGTRLAWLDVLRGLAALAVVFDHVSYYTLQHVRHIVYQWFDPGNYGVFVFFIISGYIVPASLERKGSVRTFWVSRLFRLYPLYLLAVGIAVAFYFAGFGSARGEAADPATSILSQLLMMSNVLEGKNLPNVVWSLSYEMVFYLLLTALFIARVHKRSSWYALGFAAAAVAIGGVLPQAFFTHNVATPRLIALVADLAVLAGLAFAVVLRGTSRLLGAALAAVVAIALLSFNGGWIWPWEALSILALMFTGTMFYRAEQGQYPWRRAIAIGVTVLGLAIAAGLWHSRAWGMSAHAELLWSAAGSPRSCWPADVRGRAHVPPRQVAAGADLAGPDQLLRLPAASAGHRGVPPLLPVAQHHFGVQVLIAAGLVATVVAVSSVTYLGVERPTQDVGRRVGRWLDARFGPDRMPAAAPVRPAPPMAERGRPATE